MMGGQRWLNLIVLTLAVAVSTRSRCVLVLGECLADGFGSEQWNGARTVGDVRAYVLERAKSDRLPLQRVNFRKVVF